MKRFLFLFFPLFLFSVDFDCIIVGTSPFSLFEALYQSHLGKKVLILEECTECGGAWKSITICDIPHVDLGCHQIGQSMELKSFLEEYAGCKMVCMNNPLHPQGYYFSQGSFELIDHLLQLIQATDIVLLTNHKAETVSFDPLEKTATVQTKDRTFTTQKLIVTPMSCIDFTPQTQDFAKSKYYHLYLLIQDSTPFRFTYRSGVGNGISRLMNLTPFVSLPDSDQQLIAIQTTDARNLTNGQGYLDTLKGLHLIDSSASILKAESYIYEAGSFYMGMAQKIEAEGVIEILQTGNFTALANYIERWKTVLKPYAEVMSR